MTTRDWFRKTTWSETDAKDFAERLSRSRGQRSEYLRIQAATLVDAGELQLADAAVRLANQYLQENPDGIHRSWVCATVARACELKGDLVGAAKAYRCAIEEEELRPNVRYCAYIDFAWFASTRGLSELFDDVLAAMRTSFQEADLTFPMAQYKYFGALALISHAQGDVENASRMARNATQASQKKASPFSRTLALPLRNPQGPNPYLRKV